MARVPQIQTRRVFSDIPQPNTEGAATPYKFLAEAFSQIAEVAKPSALQEAASRGAEAVTRDANGNLQADTTIPIGPLSQTYNEAARATYITEMDADISARVLQLQEANWNDPDSFARGVKEYRDNLMKTTPTLFKGDVGQLLTRRSGATQNQIITNTIRETRTRALNANNAAIDRISERVQQLAADPTPDNVAEISALQAELSQLRTIRQGLPGSGYTPENAELDNQRLTDQVLAANDTAMKTQTAVAIETLKLGQYPDNLSEVIDLVRGTEYEQQLTPYVVAREASPTFATKSPEEREKVIKNIQSEGQMNPDRAKVLDGLIKTDAAIREEEQKDPIGFAAKVGLPVPVIDPADPESYVRRADFARQLTEQGRNPSGELLSQQEAEQFTNLIKNGEPDQIVQSLAGFSSFGPEGMRKVYSEIGVDPTLAQGLSQMAGGGSPKIPFSIAAGMKTTGVKTLVAGERSEAIANVMSDFDNIANDPTNAVRYSIIKSADFIYKDLVGNQAAEPSTDTYEQALRMATGEVDGIGGIVDLNPGVFSKENKVLLPASVPQSTAQQRYRAAVDLLNVDPIATTTEGYREALPPDQIDQARERQIEEFRRVWSSYSHSGGYPMYRSGLPSANLMSDAEVISFGQDRYGLKVGENTYLKDSANPTKPFIFSFKKMTGKTQ